MLFLLFSVIFIGIFTFFTLKGHYIGSFMFGLLIILLMMGGLMSHLKNADDLVTLETQPQIIAVREAEVKNIKEILKRC
jgi:hypothetical protein